MHDGELIIDRRSERIASVLAEIGSWENEAEKRSAGQYLRRYTGSRYEGQEQLYIQNRPVGSMDEALRRRVVERLAHGLRAG